MSRALSRILRGTLRAGSLVKRGLDDEMKGTAYAIVEGVDGRTHHLRFSDLDMAGDAKPGAIVEAGSYEDAIYFADFGLESMVFSTIVHCVIRGRGENIQNQGVRALCTQGTRL
jgi:Protein of unknown function (DUF3363)